MFSHQSQHLEGGCMSQEGQGEHVFFVGDHRVPRLKVRPDEGGGLARAELTAWNSG